jgi:hypothetical protein
VIGDMMEADAIEHLAGIVTHVRRDRVIETQGSKIAGHGDFVCRQFMIELDRRGGTDKPQTPAELMQIDFAEMFTEDADIPRRRPQMPGDHFGQRALARPIRAENGSASAAGNLPINIAEYPPIGANDADGAKQDGGRGGHQRVYTGKRRHRRVRDAEVREDAA